MARDYFKEFIPKSWICLKGYDFQTFKKDLAAGITVGIVTLPLAMAYAISSGATPDRGIFTAIIAGFIVSLLGGSRVQISGPTGAFVTVLYGIIQVHGYEGLAISAIMASVLLIIMALLRLGTWIQRIPRSLTVGFTSGIALVIFSSQMKDFFGLKMGSPPGHFIGKWQAYFNASSSVDFLTLIVAILTLALIIFVRKFYPRIPWVIAGIVFSTVSCVLFQLPVETIFSRFGYLPQTLPTPHFPHLSIEKMLTLIVPALSIAMLAGLESLLSCVIADGMTGKQHKSNAELLAQGFGNLGAIFFGGIPSTGAIARTAINIKSGAHTPFAGMIHAVTTLVILLLFAPIVVRIPLAALAAVLIVVAWNMSEAHHFRKFLDGNRIDITVLLSAFFLTIFVDLIVAVVGGMIIHYGLTKAQKLGIAQS